MSPDPRPWKRVRRGPRRDHGILRVGEDTFADPRTGEQHDRVIVEAVDWCNVLPITTDRRAILVRQFRFGSQEMSLELPGGAVDGGETPVAAVARELEEETGYRAGRLEPLGAYRSNPAHFTNRVHAFVALGCERLHDGHPEGTEDLAVVTVPLARVPELAREGKITHALMLATIALATLRGYLDASAGPTGAARSAPTSPRRSRNAPRGRRPARP